MATEDQLLVAELYEAIGDKWVEPTPMDFIIWMLTELGELADTAMRLGHGGRQDYSRNHEWAAGRDDLIHEIGDLYMMLCGFANSVDIDLGDALGKRAFYLYAKYMGE